MDRWKRRPNGVLVNDDSIGYQNAKKRVERRQERLDEMNALKKRMTELAERTDKAVEASERAAAESREMAESLERKIDEMSKANDALLDLVKTIAQKVSGG